MWEHLSSFFFCIFFFFLLKECKGQKYTYNLFSSSYWEHWLFVLTFRNAVSDKKMLFSEN